MRSHPLTVHGRMVNAYKMPLCCGRRRAPPSPALVRLCKTLELNATETLHASSIKDLHKAVRAHRRVLWEHQKRGEDIRQEWLSTVAQDRARALGDPDWEHKLTQRLTANSAQSPKAGEGC